MCSVTVVMPIAFLAWAQAKKGPAVNQLADTGRKHDLAANHTGRAQDSMESLVDNLLDRMAKAPFLHTDVDGTTLGKPGHLALAPRTSPLGALPHPIPCYPSVGMQSSRFLPQQNIVSVRAPRYVVSPPRSVVVGVANLNIFSRFFRVIKSGLDQLLDSVEDPELIIDQTVREMQDDLVKLRKEVIKYMGSLKQVEAKYKDQDAEVAQWVKRAKLALSKGDEDLAREALKRKRTAEELASNYKTQLDGTKQAVDQLVANVKMIEQKVQDASAKKETLKARAKAAESSKQIVELVQGLDGGKSSLAAFEKMEKKVLALEAETEAIAALKAPEQSIMDKFTLLEAGVSIDNELKDMKSKMLTDGSKKETMALPEEASVRKLIDEELAELKKKANLK